MAFLGQMRKAVERREMEESTRYQVQRTKSVGTGDYMLEKMVLGDPIVSRI
jgi:hypothetical protein